MRKEAVKIGLICLDAFRGCVGMMISHRLNVSLRLISVFAVFAAFAGVAGESVIGRKYELGVLDYTSVYSTKYARVSKRVTNGVFSYLEKNGFEPVLVSPLLFGDENKLVRNQYKRIFIPAFCTCFTKEMYKGIADYVKSGGLLVTNTLLMHLDVNGDFKFGAPDQLDPFPVNRIMGLDGKMSGVIKYITSLEKCPITEGMKLNERISLSEHQSGRLVVRNRTATVLISSNTSGKPGDYTHMPYVTFFHIGYGATIFINGNFNARTLKDPVFAKLLMNIMSPKTLGWLCLQNETP